MSSAQIKVQQKIAMPLQITADLASKGITYNQSLAGSGAGAAGSSGNAGCNDDNRYPAARAATDTLTAAAILN